MKKGDVYKCPVCGAELSLVRVVGKGPTPRCCNTEMELTGRVNPVLVCPVCGCELMVIRGEVSSIAPRCCNTSMQMAA